MEAIWRRVVALFRSRRLERELSEEIASHLAMQEEEFRRAGMSAAEARGAARREFGGVAYTAEVYRERRGIPWIESAARDVRYTSRGLLHSPGFTVAAVLSLALGIGANTAIFSLFHTLMLSRLPIAHPEQLVQMVTTGGWSHGTSSYPLYLDLRKRTELFRDVAARTYTGKTRLEPGNGARAELVERELVTGNYFSMLGVTPVLGRVFTDDDNRTPHAHPLAVLSYDFWRNRFGSDAGIVGRTLIVDEMPLTVIGVAAPGFHGVEVDHRTELWEPAMMTPYDPMNEGMHWVTILGRVAPGVSRKAVQAAVDPVMQQHLLAHYGNYPNAAFRRKALRQRLEVSDAGAGVSQLREAFGKPLGVLMAAVGLVLLVACTNVANLLLARGAAREKETALRMSLGASRGRLVRQSLTESLLLASGGCILGTLFAFWGEGYLLRFLPAESSTPFSTAPNPAVLAFTVGVSLLSAVLFGLAPALRSTAIDPAAGLQSRAGAKGGRRTGLRRALVVAQVAFSAVLVVLAGLFGHSLADLRAIDPGFRNTNLIVFQLDFPRAWKAADIRAARQRFVSHTEALRGVLSVAYAFPGPYRTGSADTTIRVPGSALTAKEPAVVQIQYASARHFETVGSMPIVGRDFDLNDTPEARRVAVVNESFARAFFPAEANVVGRIVSFDDRKQEGGEPTYIVGVVRDMTHYGLRKGVKPTVYVPFAQREVDWKMGWPPTMLVRASAPPASLLTALHQEAERLGPQVALTEPSTIRQQIDDDIFQDRLLATLSGFFGILALTLAGIGLYGVVSYGTARRAGEIGIRIALGAGRGSVLWMVLRDALLLVTAGLVLGMPCSVAAARAVASLLFEVKPGDPAAFFMTAGVLAVIGVAAAFLPARRAATLEPLRVLRHE
jgi:predicted permease